MNKDEYTLLVWFDNSKLYYKNGKLHREDGPALVYTRGKDSVIDIVGENDHLYEKISDSEKKDEERIKKLDINVAIAKFLLEMHFPGHFYYYLEGKEYSKEAFMALKLEKELSSQNNIKNNKAKI